MKHPARQNGFSLIEILVSIVILAIGVLGSAGMMLTSIRSTSESGNYATAVNFAREYAEKARMNKRVAAIVVNGNPSPTLPGNPYIFSWKNGDAYVGAGNCISANCNAAALAAWDTLEWTQRVDTTLPSARVVVCYDNDAWNSGTGTFDWSCNANGKVLVMKIGWASKDPSGKYDNDVASLRTPRVVMSVIAGLEK
jgi:type IV pilus assembly protein PilV